MALRLGTTLLLIVVVTAVVPVAALGWFELGRTEQAANEAARVGLENAALAAAARADHAAHAGLDPWPALAMEEGVDVVLVDRDGGWTARDGSAGLSPATARSIGDATSGAFAAVHPVTGAPALVAWARAPALDRNVVLAAPPPEVWRPDASYFAVWGLLAAGAALVAVVLTERVVRPLARLGAATRALAAGEVDARVPVGGSREVRDLARTFNTMADDLAEQRARLEAYAAQSRADVASLNFTVAHELREPLRSMRTVASSVASDGGPDEAFEALRLLGERLARLERVLLDMTRFESLANADLAIGDVDLGLVVDAAAAKVPGLALARGPLPTVRGDAKRLEEAVREVLRNAVEHADGRVHVEGKTERGVAVVVFDDRGPGVAPERREDAFHLFQRLTPKAGGSGVGLAVVRRVACLHGGEATLEEAPEGGLRFALRLPVAGPPTRAVRAPPVRSF